jgi:hypothetical protein
MHTLCAQLFEYECVSHEAVSSGDGVLVRARALRDDLPSNVEVLAKKLIIATGFNVAILKPLRFTAGAAVHSIAPTDVLTTQWSYRMRFGPDADKPIFVIGSGKTALDVMYSLSKTCPDVANRIHCVAGRGMWFMNREIFHPSSAWNKYYPFADTLLDTMTRVLEHFDGNNTSEVCQRMSEEDNSFISPIADSKRFMAGTASVEEVEHVRGVLSPPEDKVFKAHLLNVVHHYGIDGPEDGAVLELKNCDTGEIERIVVPRGTFIVNCTGHVHPVPILPVLSDDGLVLTPQHFAGFTGPSACYLTHLFYAGQLERWWRSFPVWEGTSIMPAPGTFGIGLILSVIFFSSAVLLKLPPGACKMWCSLHCTHSPS